MSAFAIAFRCEWAKTRRSLAIWLAVVGALFTPAIVTAARLFDRAHLPALYATGTFWRDLWTSAWESMAIFLLPMAAILTASLVVQVEYRNNAWKQLHTLPLRPTTLFFAKLGVVLVLIALMLALFDAAIWLSAVAPWLAVRGVPYPDAPFPAGAFARETLCYFVDCLPIVAAQYALSLHFRNFLVAIGFGFLAWIAALAAVSSSFGHWIPYSYTLFDYLMARPNTRVHAPPIDMHLLASAYAVAITAVGYLFFVTRRQKG
jgi:lantibiotic transport system permease protein